MKPFLKTLSIAAFALTLTATLTACETVEGLKNDISDIDFGSIADFSTASSVQEEQHANFLVDGNCPSIQIVEDLGRLYEFNAGQSMKSSNLVSSVKMEEAQSTCEFGNRSVTVDLKLAFDGKLGPKGRRSSTEKPAFTYPFFVAVTTDSGKILAKEIFAASMTYSASQNEQLYFETLRQIIPADSRAQGSRYKIMVGFQLAEKQLAYNRTLIEAETLAAQKLEMERLAAEKAAIEQAEIAAKMAKDSGNVTQSAIEEGKVIIEKTSTVTAPAPKVERAGPFDIFKTDNN